MCVLAAPVMAQPEETTILRLPAAVVVVATPTPTYMVSEATETTQSTTPSAFCDVDQDALGESDLGVIRGRVINGSVGGEVPEGLEVNLFGLNDQQVVVRETVELTSDGEFIFEDILVVDSWLFFIAAEHQGVLYYTASEAIPSAGEPLELALEIFDSTESDAFIRVEQLHILFDFNSPDAVRVLEVWVISNTGDRTYVSSDGGIEIVLPQGASQLQFDEGELGERFLQAEGGFIDTAAVLPGLGTQELLFTYEIPHAGRLDFTQPIGYAVLGVEVMIPEGGPTIVTGALQDHGVRQVSTGPLRTYITGPLESGDMLSFSIAESVSDPVIARGSDALTGLWIGGGILAATLIAVGYAWRRTSLRRTREEAIQHPDDLLQAIADLDNEHALGRIEEGEYQRQREELKRRALYRMRTEDD